MAKNKNNNGSRWSWKKMVCAFLAFAAVVVCVGGITAIAKNDTKTISLGAFRVGALDENGKYVENDQAIYTKEAFECIGLRVEPEFDAELTYDVYYYDYNGNMIEKKLGLEGINDEDFPLAKMARVVVHPAIPEDVDEDDFKINWYNVAEYANKIKITVDKKQVYLYENCINLYDENKVEQGMSVCQDDEIVNSVTLTAREGVKATHMIDVADGVDEYHVFVRAPYPPTAYINATIGDENGKSLRLRYFNLFDYYGSDSSKVCWVKLVVEVPDNEAVDHLRVSMPSNAECYIFAVD